MTWRERVAELGLAVDEFCVEGHLRTDANTRINVRWDLRLGRRRMTRVRCLDCARVADPRYERMGGMEPGRDPWTADGGVVAGRLDG